MTSREVLAAVQKTYYYINASSLRLTYYYQASFILNIGNNRITFCFFPFVMLCVTVYVHRSRNKNSRRNCIIFFWNSVVVHNTFADNRAYLKRILRKAFRKS